METIEFNTTYSALTGEHVGTWYIPYVTYSDSEGMLIDDIPRARVEDWHALTGHRSFAFGAGNADPIFDPAETATDDQIRAWVREAGGDVFAVVEVHACDHDGAPHGEECPCDVCNDAVYCQEYGCPNAPAGWAVIYRDADA